MSHQQDASGGGVSARTAALFNQNTSTDVLDMSKTPGGTAALVFEPTILRVLHDDIKAVDQFQAKRMPPFVAKEIANYQYKEACRRCYELEKVMSRCLQDKLWTAWKCQKERDSYYGCVDQYKMDRTVGEGMRWKYALGTFQGEVVARRRVMQNLWKEHFPDRDLQHTWATD